MKDEQELPRKRHASSRSCPGGGGGADSISALPNDLLHQVLARLGCARAAARTSILSRRWRAVWTGLPDLVFRGVAPGSLLPVLASLQAAGGPGVSLLDIVVPGPDLAGTDHVPALIHAAAALSPEDFRLSQMHSFVHARFPQFHRAASADLRGLSVLFPGPPPSFPALQMLSLTDCSVHLPALLLNCPRLRALQLNACMLCQDHVTVHSTALQELIVSIKVTPINRIDVDTPALKQLTMHFDTGDKLAVSVSAPVLEKLTWGFSYTEEAAGLGCWVLKAVNSDTVERGRDDDQDAISNLPRKTKLLLHYSSWLRHNKGLYFLKEIEKHMVDDLSVLELYFVTMGHVFGAFVVHLLGMQLLGMHRICTPTRSLKIFLRASKAKGEECREYCRCSMYMDPDWRSQTNETMSLVDLEEVEIKGLEGEDHELDFVQLIFRCAPTLRRVALRLSSEATPCEEWCTKIYNMFKEYHLVKNSLVLGSGLMYTSQSCGLST